MWEIKSNEIPSLRVLNNKHEFFNEAITEQIHVLIDTMILQRDMVEGTDEFVLFNERATQLSSLFRDFYWMEPEQFEVFLILNDPETSTDIFGNLNTAKSSSL